MGIQKFCLFISTGDDEEGVYEKVSTGIPGLIISSDDAVCGLDGVTNGVDGTTGEAGGVDDDAGRTDGRGGNEGKTED